jgi:uncharacterized protein (DUF488 family)
MRVYSIGFTKRTAAQFFGALRAAGVRRLVDVRLRNSSQLAGFTKQTDLPFFLRELCDADYRHEPLLSPSQELFDFRRKQGGDWDEYQRHFLELLASRRVEERLNRAIFDVPTVLLCTETTAEECHRRLVLEYLQRHWGGLEIVHL